MEAFVKSWGPGGLDLTKALTANPGITDAAAITGGGALATQSLDRRIQSYWDFRDRAAEAVLRKRVPRAGPDIARYATQHFGLSEAEAAEFSERFMADVGRARAKKELN
jgi:hypothetical protein